MKVLIAEDDATSALLLQRTLQKGGHTVTVTRNGLEALEAATRSSFDALLTDWMMPGMDGIELIRRVRTTVQPVPAIMFVTALGSPDARNYALQAGADEYLVKPYDGKQVLELLQLCLRRRDQPLPRATRPPMLKQEGPPPFVGVVIAASTGGPPTLLELFRCLPANDRAAFFVVLHGPGWMLESFAPRLQQETKLRVHLGRDGQAVAPGEVYVAPGDRHMQVARTPPTLRLLDEPQENFVRPAADPLFRSAARLFGAGSIAVVLTGLGRDGSVGCEHIAAASGVVLVQDPSTAVAASMPQSVLSMGVPADVVPIGILPSVLHRHIELLSRRRSQSLAPR